MNDIPSYNARALTLFLAGSALITMSALVTSFPLFIFIAFAPFFALLDFSWSSKIYFVLLASVAGLLTEIVLYSFDLNTPALTYIFLITALFCSFRIAQQFTQNRLNKFTLVILVIALEFLLLKFLTQTDPFFLADFVRYKPEWTRWNMYTGYLGTSLWIMATNLLMYQAIFKSGKVNILFALIGVLSIVVPILYSLQLENDTITKQEMLNAYSINPSSLKNAYTPYGELISRTGAWVSILIIIFTLVRIKTRKVAR